jgi:hypothetical protein
VKESGTPELGIDGPKRATIKVRPYVFILPFFALLPLFF